MKVDLRGFDYALEPLRSQRRWQLEGLQAQLGRVQGQIAEREQRLDELRSHYEVQRTNASRALAHRLDPSAHGQAVAWLSRLRHAIASAEEALGVLREQRARLAERCLVQQQKVDVIERHREECQADFVTEAQAHLASEADRDWLSRRQAASASAGPTGKGGKR